MSYVHDITSPIYCESVIIHERIATYMYVYVRIVRSYSLYVLSYKLDNTDTIIMSSNSLYQ